MTNRRHIEELWDMLSHLKQEAEFLYRYGNLASCEDFFNNLSLVDKKRLIYFALTDGNKDMQNVAHYFMKKLSPAPGNLEELLAQMSSEDKEEVAGFMKERLSGPKALTGIDRQRITEELQKACDQLGTLEVEEAFWVLIPNEPEKEAIWIEAIGGKDKDLSRLRFSFTVIYDPEKEERYELITSMRKACWILHLHNHPAFPGYLKPYEPSSDDKGFAAQWQMYRPELAKKMMFFVISGDRITLYGGRLDLE